MTWLRRGFKAFRRYAARTLRHRWTRDHTCNVQIPTVCSLWHRHSEHQTWTTHRYWFCLSPFWQQQDSPYRILSLVSIYFIIMYLVCTFSVAVFGSYISGKFKRESWLYKGRWIGGLSEFLQFWLVTHHFTNAPFSAVTVRKDMKYTCSHPFANYSPQIKGKYRLQRCRPLYG